MKLLFKGGVYGPKETFGIFCGAADRGMEPLEGGAVVAQDWAGVQPGFETLLKLLRSGTAYVKISGAYRSSTLGPDYPDLVPLAKALIAENPQRILWGTDWPHPS